MKRFSKNAKRLAAYKQYKNLFEKNKMFKKL